MSEHAFQFTPAGVMSSAEANAFAAAIDVERVNGNGTAPPQPAPLVVQPRMGISYPAMLAAAASPEPTSPRNIVREARARVREIDAELRRLRGLQKERDELARLIAAAKQKPAAKVRALRAAGS